MLIPPLFVFLEICFQEMGKKKQIQKKRKKCLKSSAEKGSYLWGPRNLNSRRVQNVLGLVCFQIHFRIFVFMYFQFLHFYISESLYFCSSAFAPRSSLLQGCRNLQINSYFCIFCCFIFLYFCISVFPNFAFSSRLTSVQGCRKLQSSCSCNLE